MLRHPPGLRLGGGCRNLAETMLAAEDVADLSRFAVNLSARPHCGHSNQHQGSPVGLPLLNRGLTRHGRVIRPPCDGWRSAFDCTLGRDATLPLPLIHRGRAGVVPVLATVAALRDPPA